jgi:hypothetical protein
MEIKRDKTGAEALQLQNNKLLQNQVRPGKHLNTNILRKNSKKERCLSSNIRKKKKFL